MDPLLGCVRWPHAWNRLLRGTERGCHEETPGGKPFAGVEFPVSVRGLFPPHYVTWSEQQMIEDSKTSNAVAEVPLTAPSAQAFQDQLRIAGPGVYWFPSDKNEFGRQATSKTVWHKTLKRAKIP